VQLVEHVPDGFCDLPLSQGLYDKCPDARRRCPVRIDEVAEARAHNERHVGPQGEDLFCKLDPCHIRHGLIGDDEVEP
jgi:hypothetical protein